MGAVNVFGAINEVPERLKCIFSTPAECEFLHHVVGNSLKRKDGENVDKINVKLPKIINYQSWFNRMKHSNACKYERYTELERIARKFIKINDLNVGLSSQVELLETYARRQNQRTMAYETLIGNDRLVVGCVGYSSNDTKGLFDGMPNIEWMVPNPTSVSGSQFGPYAVEKMNRFVRYWLREHD